MNFMRVSLTIYLILLGAVPQAEDIFDIAQTYNREKLKVNELEQQHRQALAEVYRIEKETEKIVIKKAELDEKRAQIDHEMNQLSLSIIDLENNLKQVTPELSRRIDLSEKVNSMPWLYSLVSSQSVLDLEEMMDVVESLNQDQSEKIVEFINIHKAILAKKEELKVVAKKIIKLEQDVLNKEKNIAQKQEQKRLQLKKVKKFLSIRKNKLDRLKDKGHALSKRDEFKDLEILFDQGFSEKQGQLSVPVQGQLIQGFGLNRGLSYDQVQALHKGHFYKTQKSQEVINIATGRVVHAGHQSGYGFVVIVDHGGRYYSTYGNLHKANVKLGEAVEEKQTIGETGHSHLQMGVGLYFEIRHFSEPQDPSKWLKPHNSSLANL